jgi:hypothetical protein
MDASSGSEKTPPSGTSNQEPTKPTEESTPEASPSPVSTRLLRIEGHPELLGWVLITLITVGVAAWIYWIQLAYPIAPGSDPGSWISMSYGYIGGHYPGQVNPYGYPPLLFPILGALVLLTQNPVLTGHLIVPILAVALGLSTYALSRAFLRSVILSLALVTILLLDPYFMTMFFWGALPNLLAFSFMNLSLLGLAWTGFGRSTRGPVFFWVFGAATVLTHSLAGLALGATVVIALFLSMFIPLHVSKTASAKFAPDAPPLLIRRLMFSWPGFVGLICFIIAVGGWNIATYAAGIPHPSYLATASAPHPATYGQFLRNLLPGLVLTRVTVFYVLVCLVTLAFAVFGAILTFRYRWVTTPLLLLFSSWIGVSGIAIIGWLLDISTDYHRFGFFLVIPAGLTIAYLVDRLWLLRGPTGGPTAEPTDLPPELRPIPPTIRTTHRVRTGFVAVFALVIILLVAGVASTAYKQYEIQNTGPTHDQNFVNALNSIDHSGLPGSVLTIRGAFKWTWAITNREAYAPRPGNAFLFYPVQITDSVLAYYALTSRDAMTNNLVSASLAGTNPAYVDGIPDYSVFQNGGLTGTLQIPPQLVQVTLVGATNHTAYVVGLSGSPTFQAPSAPGQPGVITYTEPSFVFRQLVFITPGIPTATITSQVQATGSDLLASVREIITAPAPLEAITAQTGEGAFLWKTYNLHPLYQGLLTYGNVTPASALQGVTDYYNGSSCVTTCGAAAVLDYTPPGSVPVPSLTGSINVTTPLALGGIPNLPPTVNTMDVWNQLGIRFILIPNDDSFTLYAGSYLLYEAGYLIGEFGCQPYYSNSEWVVLTVPN